MRSRLTRDARQRDQVDSVFDRCPKLAYRRSGRRSREAGAITGRGLVEVPCPIRGPGRSRSWLRRSSGHVHVRSVKPSPTESRFPGGVGNTQKDQARFDSLLAGVTDKIFGRLPDATWVYPGRGGHTTLGAERPHLEEWRARGW